MCDLQTLRPLRAGGFRLRLQPGRGLVAVAFDAQGQSVLADDFGTAEAAGAAALEVCREKFSGDCRVGAVASRTAMAVVKDSGGWGQASGPDPGKAAKKALAECGKHAKGCRLTQAAWDAGPLWTALAIGADTYHLAYNVPSRAAAESAAVDRCRKTSNQPDSCKLDSTMTAAAEAHYAIATSSTSPGVRRAADQAAAQEQALAQCGKAAAADSQCALRSVVHNAGALQRSQSMDVLERQIARTSIAADSPQRPASTPKP